MEIIFVLAFLILIVLWVLTPIALIQPKILQSLSKGKTISRKQIALGWLIGTIILLIIIAITSPDPATVQKAVETKPHQEIAAAPEIKKEIVPVKVDYKIISDESTGDIVRKVNVELAERINKTQLEKIAYEIKNSNSNMFERTLILYRLKGEKSVAAWATTHFDPDLDVNFIGLDANDYRKLIEKDITVDGQIIGKWYATGGYERIVVIYKKDGQYFEKNYFVDGSASPEGKKLKFKNGKYSYSDSNENWHFLVNDAGDLEYWGENGNSTTAKKLD